MNQRQKAEWFKGLHIKGQPLILCNIWDAGSAKVIQSGGAKAIATSSWAVAASQGYEDGEQLPFEYALDNVKRIVANVHLPVTVDIEAGYGQHPAEVQKTARCIIEAGAVGINIEDRIIGEEALYSIEQQCAHIEKIREAAEQLAIPLFINARTDIFMKLYTNRYTDFHLEETIQRALAYAKAGADGIFVPCLQETRYIEILCKHSPIPVNIMVSSPDSVKELAALGVSRISYGPAPYCLAVEALLQTVRGAFLGNLA